MFLNEKGYIDNLIFGAQTTALDDFKREQLDLVLAIKTAAQNLKSAGRTIELNEFVGSQRNMRTMKWFLEQSDDEISDLIQQSHLLKIDRTIPMDLLKDGFLSVHSRQCLVIEALRECLKQFGVVILAESGVADLIFSSWLMRANSVDIQRYALDKMVVNLNYEALNAAMRRRQQKQTGKGFCPSLFHNELSYMRSVRAC
ncbi:hypothetical protein [Ferrimonas kyonanensis]|uniref:hypothetical protein n=1 Tax=Ferrimonas kyonanensis TaxID=364763 RepID=UPI0004830979|nr:hypothetical protein [Ferrimonas kyonanensis]